MILMLLTMAFLASDEATEFVRQSTKIDPESLLFLESLQCTKCKEYQDLQTRPIDEKDPKKCSTILPIAHIEKEGNILVFASFSLPINTWKEFSHFLEKTRGEFVMRGIPKNSFLLFSAKVQELKKSGVNASIRIDPEAFQKYNIQAVPTLIVERGGEFDKVSGNIRPQDALNLMIRSGNNSELCRKILKTVDGSNAD